MANDPEASNQTPVEQTLFDAEPTIHGTHEMGITPRVTVEYTMPADQPEVPEGPVVYTAEITDVRERAAHLITSLNFLAQVSKRRGFRVASDSESPHRQKLADRYGEAHLDAFSEEVGHNKNSLLRAAGIEFKKAYEAGNGSIDTEDETFKRAWADFYRKFNGSENRRARDLQRKIFKKLVAMEGIPTPADTYTLEETVADVTGTEEQAPKLNKQEKLDIFKDDPRLRFAPATNKEEENARRILNYDHEHGMLELLDEIDRHNVKEFMKQGMSLSKAKQQGDIARTSVVHEWGSYLGNAKQQIANLKDLMDKLDGVNPNLTIADALDGENHPGVAAVVREVDFDAFHAGGKEALGYDPLLTRQDRSPQANPDRNKTVEDRYTTRTPEEMIQERIDSWAETTTVGQLRKLRRLESSMTRQSNRFNFWYKALRSTEGADKRVANEIREELGLAA